MTKTTCIKDCAWVVAWDNQTERHHYLRDVDVSFTGNAITFVGKGYDGPADHEIDGRQLLVLPGFVDIHSHPSAESANKGVREEHGVPEMYMSGLYERLGAFHLDEEGQSASAEIAFCELLTSGVTTVVDLSEAYPDWIDLLARSGLRGYVAPGYASSSWQMDNRHELKYRWDEAAGRKAMDQALELITEAEAHPCGRLTGMLYPAQIDTCSADLLRDSVDAARERGRPLQTHAAQSVVEFNVMIQRYGKTPILWASDIGLLGPNTILGHAVFADHHSWLHWSTRTDLGVLAASQTSVAHCPVVFSRYGQTMQNLGRYLRAGVNVGIGTDCAPHNIIEEIRAAAIFARVSAEDIFTITTEDVFHAATVGSAEALLRDDIGRLAPGMKADIVLVDLAHPPMMPVRDPLRSLIYHAADRSVRDVYVDGVRVVENGKVLTLDFRDACGRLEEAQRHMLEAAPSHDYASRTDQEISPLSLRMG